MKKKTKNNHYVSQCISKNFTNPLLDNNTMRFYQLDCSLKTDPPITTRNINKLFSSRRIWSQEMEDSICRSENTYSKIITRLLKKTHIPYNFATSDSMEGGFIQFFWEKVEEIEDINSLNKLLFQTISLQIKNSSPEKREENMPHLSNIYDYNFSTDMDLYCVYTFNDNFPLILLDSMPKTFTSPKSLKSNKNSELEYDVNFYMPISPSVFLFWGEINNLYFFYRCMKNSHNINLNSIKQCDYQCFVASQDENYLRNVLLPDLKKSRFSNLVSMQIIPRTILELQ